MSAYAGPWRVVSAEPVPAPLLALARKLVGGLIEVGGIPQRQWNLPDGSTIHVLLVAGVPKVTITQPKGSQTSSAELFNLWAPRGFVVYPAWADAPLGIGLPIVAAPDQGTYAAANLAPGLQRSRWTAGGTCGEVLLSKDTDAGYPPARAIPVPLLYHPTKGPVFHWTGATVFDARTPRGAWSGYRLELAGFVAHDDKEDTAGQAALFEGCNAIRTAAGVPATTLRLRGIGRPAEIMARIMDAAGTDAATDASYPDTYKLPADRLTKDGYTADWMAAAFPTFNRADAFRAYELRASGNAAAAVAAWTADGDSTASITADARTVFADVGDYNGRCCLSLQGRDRWIAAGNMSWQSGNANLPPISWHGFASLNLAWETYPALYDRTNYLTAPLVPLIAFTTDQGDPWLYYPRATTPASDTIEPAMGRHVYCRGRAIALAPEGSLVWGACVMAGLQLVIGGGTVRRDRLVLLAHHPADQPTDYTNEGWTRYLRVWWADVPPRMLGLDPRQVICGTDPDDALAWRGGDMLDVGHMPAPSTGGTVADGAVSSLKMASQWRFSADGRRAVCLRDFGLYGDYTDLATSGLAQYDGKVPRAVELTFTPTSDALGVAVTFHDYTAGVLAGVHQDGADYEFGAVPLAVDFAADGSLLYAYKAVTFDAIAGGSPASGSTETTWLGIGDASVRWASELRQAVAVAANKRTGAMDFRATSYVQVADVRRAAFVAEGMHAQLQAGTLDPNPDYIACWPFTAAEAHGVRMLLDGALVSERWYPIPDGAVVAPLLACDVNTPGANAEAVFLPLAASANVQAYWAERFGEHVFAHQCSPTPQAVAIRNDDNPDGDCGCTVSAWDVASRTHPMAFDELNPRGGHALASVPLPDADWLIFAKAL